MSCYTVWKMVSPKRECYFGKVRKFWKVTFVSHLRNNVSAVLKWFLHYSGLFFTQCEIYIPPETTIMSPSYRKHSRTQLESYLFRVRYKLYKTKFQTILFVAVEYYCAQESNAYVCDFQKTFWIVAQGFSVFGRNPNFGTLNNYIFISSAKYE